MKANELTLNLRVEYAATAKIWIDNKEVKATAKRHYVGYVKRVYRKWFTWYADIVENKTRRVDTVKATDIYGEYERKERTNNKTKTEENGNI